MTVICTKCGCTDISCEAMINPNNKDFKHYTDEAFKYGWCERCKLGTVLTDVGEVKQNIKSRFQEFVEENKREPEYANCRIVWKDTNQEEDVKIQLSADSNPDVDDDMFFYCDSLEDLKSLTEFGGEDFIVTECYGFDVLSEEEILNKTKYDFEIGGEKISVTRQEVCDFYQEQYNLTEQDIEKYAALYTAKCKYYRMCDRWLDPTLVQRLLDEEYLMKRGESDGFKLQLHFTWYAQIRKEDERDYAPFKYIVNAYCLDNIQTFERRYVSLDEALLHCLNGFNENKSIPDRYQSINEYLTKRSMS